MGRLQSQPARHSERTVYEVRRLRKSGSQTVEEHPALDRARLAALGYALDGDWAEGLASRTALTGIVEIHRLFYQGGKCLRSTLIDVLDERVAFRVLSEIRLPRAGQLSVSVEKLQKEVDALARIGA